MRCLICGFENPEGMKFCGECGTPFQSCCPQCGFENPPRFKFCGECGMSLTVQAPQSQTLAPTLQPPLSYTPPHLAERILAEQAAMEARGAVDGERKTITALFADIKGSMELMEDLDPEEARSLIDPALQLMMEAVHRYDGYVAQALGDGIFALFGAPIAHEDHPQRALYAALRMQEEMRHYSDTLRRKGRAPLLMRIGVNTGEVVVRSIRKDDLHADYVPVGHSTNLAARMEQLAAPGAILVTEQTHKLTQGYFELKPLGPTRLKGMEEPLHIYEVLGVGPLRTKLQVAARRGLTRFVGRQGELEQMRRALEQAQAGHGQIVGVMGEPGVGKSRLFYEFKLTSQSGCLLLEAFSLSHGKASPYLPVIELLRGYFGIQPRDDGRIQRERAIGKVLGLDRSLEDTLPYFLALLGLEEPGSSLAQMDPQIRRRRTFEALKRLFLRESLNQPLILIFEDLHWIDPETQGFLDTLVEGLASARVLLLVNYRPEHRHEWGAKTYCTQLRLAPLGREEAEELLGFLLGNDASLRPLKKLVLEKTEGTPFFMEEVVQTLAEEGVLVGEKGNTRLGKAPTELQISPTVQGVLASRIDRLEAAEKELLQQVAVIGREFSLSLLRQVLRRPEEELHRLLASLQSKEFLYERPAFPEVEVLFKHALTQEVAYGTVLLERRRVLHERTAQALEALYPLNLEDHYNELAHHYPRSRNAGKAVEYLGLVGQQAVQKSAYTEAIDYLTAALELLPTLPETLERARQELFLQTTLGPALMITRGHGSPEVEKTYTRAQELCQQVKDNRQLFRVQAGLRMYYTMRGKLQMALEMAEQLLSLARNEQDPSFLLKAYQDMGNCLFWLGEFPSSREYFEQGIALYGHPEGRSHAMLYPLDPEEVCLSQGAWGLWFLGYPDQALKRGHEAITLAQELSSPYDLANALSLLGYIYQVRREGQAAQEQAEAVIAVSTEHGFPLYVGIGAILRSWALAEQGQVEDGIRQMQQGRADSRTTGTTLITTYFLALLAEVYEKGGQAERGLSLLTRALAVPDNTGERFYEAELHRLKGELLLKSKVEGPELRVERFSEAEACFHQAIDIARRQGAKSLELRAVMSLSRLLQRRGRQEEARQRLAEVYGWFTEGFDTPDLKEAKLLLEEMS